ncbi:MAG: hydrolase Nlp/P60 [Lachnospiraceae bacterium]|jgi:cell wall-associated NlpC family hydrolase|uniref:C40 family peptidase n=1 Tax=Candidatus Merdisoma sp. JLR.KK006 TaxID=3112626 RepID=UPI002FF3DD45|nr:hydrolase Nlp/P60 [Lachnospiraceae bacterium]
MKKIKKIHIRAIAAALTVCLCFSIQASATEADLKKQQKETQRQLDEINNQMKTIESQQRAVLAEIDSLGSDLMELVMNLEILEADLELKQEELEQAKADYEAAKKREEEQYEAMKLRIQYIYEEGEGSYLTMFLEASSFADFLNRQEYAHEIHKQDREMLTAYQETRAQVAELRDQLEQEKAEMETLQAEYEEEKAAVESTLAQKKAQEADYENQLASAQAKAKEYKNKIKEQTAQLKKLEAERRRREAEAAAAAAAAAAANSGGTTGTITGGATSAGNTGGSTGGSAGGNTGGSTGGNTGGGTTVSGNSSKGRDIANFALRYVGNPYVSGGTSLTNGADCSGFTQAVFRNFGISIPRTSDSQGRGGREVSYSEAQAGDIIYYGGHVAIYLGGGRIVHASTPATGIKTENALYRSIRSVRRYY